MSSLIIVAIVYYIADFATVLFLLQHAIYNYCDARYNFEFYAFLDRGETFLFERITRSFSGE